jgi:hypothetical protein
MTLIRITSVDPGKATGWAGGTYSDTEPFTLDWATITPDWDSGVDLWFNGFDNQRADLRRLVVEKFTLRSKTFVPDITGVKLEGLIEGTYEQYFDELIYRTPAGKGKAGKNSGTSEFDKELKRLGMWQTGSMVGHKDGRDANDAIIHILKLLIHERHLPTLEAYFPDEI